MLMPSRVHLDAETDKFFTLHWGLPLDTPHWDYSWTFCGPVPNYLLGGLYALFAGESLVYVGLGASRGGGIYQDRGISRRLIAHVLRPSSDKAVADYELAQRWVDAGVTKVATLGFPTEYNYMALALEDYLIGKLSPSQNKLKNSEQPI